MSDKQWEVFFELMGKIVNMEDMSANEKITLFQRKATEYGSETDLSEFASYMPQD